MSRFLFLATSIGTQALALLVSLVLLYLGGVLFFQALSIVNVLSHVFSVILTLLMLPTLHQALHILLVEKHLTNWKSRHQARTSS